MNRSGRVSILGLGGLFAIILFAAVFLLSRDSLSVVGGRFMDALAKRDVDTLTKMTYLGNETQEEIHKQWEFTCNPAGRYYNFLYHITAASQADPKSGSVQMQVTRDATNPGAYEENFQLPMVKVGDEWK